MAGGSVVAAGGLLAIGLGHATSYVALGLAAAVVYVGLNALTTAHRTLVAEDIGDDRRPAATGAQEVAAAAGGAIAVGVGAALIEPSPSAAFAIGAVVLLALRCRPCCSRARPRSATGDARGADGSRARVARRSAPAPAGAREVLLAQTLWVFAYAALPAFFVLYAEDDPRARRRRRGCCCRSRSARSWPLGLAIGGRTPRRARLRPPDHRRRDAGRRPARGARPRRRSRSPRSRSPPPDSAPGCSPRSASPTSPASSRRARRAATAAPSSRAAASRRRLRCRWPASRSS